MHVTTKISGIHASIQSKTTGLLPRIRPVVTHPMFRRLYLGFGLAVLLVTSGFWAFLGAKLQAANADQLSDPLLFRSSATFHGASFPGTHTFLLKWPIFWLLKLFGTSALSLEVATVSVVLLTVGCLAAVLYKIERRPLVFGTICFSLATALLLVPAQPYAGGLLPVNMAMLTTRNLEYIVYIVALVYFVRSMKFRSRNFMVGVGVLSVLIASDKLFLSLSAGGALVGLVIYAAARNWAYVTLSLRWLVGTMMAWIGSGVILGFITLFHFTHLVNENGASPFALVSGVKNLVLGVSYAVLGLLTNVGGNPVYDSTQLAQLPGQLLHRAFSLSGIAHLLAAAMFIYAVRLSWRFVLPSLRNVGRRAAKRTTAGQLATLLILSTLAAIGVFVTTDHYYAVDSRYLAIIIFAAPIVAAVALRKRKLRAEYVAVLGLLLLGGAVIGVFAAQGSYSRQQAALRTTEARNGLVQQALNQHPVNVLVGDYWRVLPTKLASKNDLKVLPLGNCTQPRTTLTSKAWQPDLHKSSFAYLISLDGSLTDFPHCSLSQVTAHYGRPSATQLIAGTLSHPKEVLLFYDYGSHKSTHPTPSRAPTATALIPISTDELLGTNCRNPTIMNIVAHQDDDLLFLSPDLLHDIHVGHCVRTVFLTAGDSGYDRFYWLNRQRGSEAAYDAMLGHKSKWIQRTVRLADNNYVTIDSPDDNSTISLIFFNLPDGGLHGEGFPASYKESLVKLQAGAMPQIHTVDGQSVYTAEQLTAALSNLMDIYQPAEIHTQADVPSNKYPDHSDHSAAGKLAEMAGQQYSQQQFAGAIAIPVKRYIGYPIHGYERNVSGIDLQEKESAFLAYAQYDGGVCHSLLQCAATPTYGAYISRQYQEDTAKP